MNKILLIILTGALILISGCSPVTKYKSVEETALSSYFSVQDQVSLVNIISQKFNTSEVINNEIPNRVTLLVDKIINKTSEHIDTESITDTLKSNILVKGKFKIINRRNLNLLAKEQQLNSLGLTDSNRAAQLGKLYGAQYVLYGNFSSIVNYTSAGKNTYYKLTMFLQNIETGEEVWIGESTINKVTK